MLLWFVSQENLLVTASGNIKLADFGTASAFDQAAHKAWLLEQNGWWPAKSEQDRQLHTTPAKSEHSNQLHTTPAKSVQDNQPLMSPIPTMPSPACYSTGGDLSNGMIGDTFLSPSSSSGGGRGDDDLSVSLRFVLHPQLTLVSPWLEHVVVLDILLLVMWRAWRARCG